MRTQFICLFITGIFFLNISSVEAADTEKYCVFSAAGGFKLESFDYRELSESNRLIDKETGLLPGLQLGLAADCNKWQFAASAVRQSARLEYDGQTSGGRKLFSRTLENISEVSAQARRHFSTELINHFDIYVGAGYRQWRREIASVGNVSGLDETYRWRFYYLGGNSTVFQLGAHQLILDVRWLRMSQAKLSVDFLGVFDKPADLALPVRNGWRVAFPWHYTLDAANTISAEPYAQGWRSPRGEAKPLARNGVVVGDFFEPASQTLLYGINATWSHWF